MKFLATFITVICLLIVSTMGNSIIFVCALMGCEIVIMGCTMETQPEKCSPCSDYEDLCGASSCQPCEPAKIPVTADPCPLPGLMNQTCDCARSDPRLTAVLEDYRYKGPETSVSKISSPDAVFKTVPHKSIKEFDCVYGINPIIATTVLRL